MFIYIYADILFAINFIADYLALYITSRLTSSRSSAFRLSLASLLGALFACVVICTNMQNALTVISTIVVSFVMCYVAFGKRSVRPFFSLVFFFYLSAALLFGGAYALQSLISLARGSSANVTSFALIIISILACTFIYIVLSPKITKGVKAKNDEVICIIDDGERIYNLTLICDSGNFARDPFSGKPVTIIKKSSVSPKLYNSLSGYLENHGDGDEYVNIKPRVIPIKTVSGTSLLYAFIPKSVTIKKGKQTALVDTIVAIDSNGNNFSGKDGIIPYSIVEYL